MGSELVVVPYNGKKGGVYIAKVLETTVVDETEKEKAFKLASAIVDKDPTLLFIKTDEGCDVRSLPKLYPDIKEGDVVSYANESGVKKVGEVFYVGKGELKEGYFFSLVEPHKEK